MPRTYFPETVNSHVIGRKWICDEDSRLSALGIWKWDNQSRAPSKAIRKGLTLDEWLKLRPKSLDEQRLINQIDAAIEERMDGLWKDRLGYAAARPFQGTYVIAHPDDFHCYWNRREKVKVVWFAEYKGLTAPEWKFWESPAARCQVKIAAWVWEPYWRQLGWETKDSMWIEYYSLRDNTFLERDVEPYKAEDVEAILDDAFKLYRGDRPPIPPKPFKCKGCNKRHYCGVLAAGGSEPSQNV